jgi:hypothetical protein
VPSPPADDASACESAFDACIEDLQLAEEVRDAWLCEILEEEGLLPHRVDPERVSGHLNPGEVDTVADVVGSELLQRRSGGDVSSSSSSSSSSGSSVDSDEYAQCERVIESALGEPSSAAASAGSTVAAKRSRLANPPGKKRDPKSQPWGIWSIAPVEKHGICIGFGVVCGLHCDSDNPDAVCKRQLQLGTRMPMPQSECRIRLKSWLIAGYKIGQGRMSKSEHFAIKPRNLELVPESDLDAQAAAILAKHEEELCR